MKKGSFQLEIDDEYFGNTFLHYKHHENQLETKNKIIRKRKKREKKRKRGRERVERERERENIIIGINYVEDVIHDDMMDYVMLIVV